MTPPSGPPGIGRFIARHLLEIASVLCEKTCGRRLNYAGLAMTRRSQVERRILAILDLNRPLSQRLTRGTLLLLVAATVPPRGDCRGTKSGGGNSEGFGGSRADSDGNAPGSSGRSFRRRQRADWPGQTGEFDGRIPFCTVELWMHSRSRSRE